MPIHSAWSSQPLNPRPAFRVMAEVKFKRCAIHRGNAACPLKAEANAFALDVAGIPLPISAFQKSISFWTLLYVSVSTWSSNKLKIGQRRENIARTVDGTSYNVTRNFIISKGGRKSQQLWICRWDRSTTTIHIRTPSITRAS